MLFYSPKSFAFFMSSTVARFLHSFLALVLYSFGLRTDRVSTFSSVYKFQTFSNNNNK